MNIFEIENPILLARYIFNEHTADENNRNYSGKLHPSSIATGCLRKYILGFRHEITIRKQTGTFLRSVFERGNFVHWLVQNDPVYLGNKLIGYWKCLSCRYKIFGRKPTSDCPNCGGRKEVFIYTEFTIAHSGKFKILGNIDLIIEINPGVFVIADIKTMSGKDYLSLDVPKEDHCLQLQSYMLFYPNDNAPVKVRKDIGLLIYIPKDDYSTQYSFKCFWVKQENTKAKFIAETAFIFSYCIENTKYLPPIKQKCLESKWNKGLSKRCELKDLCKKYQKTKICTFEIAKKGLEKIYEKEN